MGGAPIAAGRLIHYLQLQAPTASRSAGGGVTESFATQATIWGRIEPVGGREAFEGGKYTGELTHRIRIRFRTDIKRTWRVYYPDHATSPATDRYFGIVAILPVGEGRRELHLMVQEHPDGQPV